jgi:hypothetical protein
MFTRSGTTWTQQAYIKASNAEAGDSFGVMVALSDDGNTLLTASLDEDCLATGVNPKECDNDFKADRSAGAAYIFVRNGAMWSEQAFIKASNSGANDWFGSRSALSGDGNTAVFGASLEDSSGRGVDGKQDDDKAPESGAVYFYRRNGTTWSQQHYVKAANADAYDEFGGSVAIGRDGRTIVVSAHGEDGSARGAGGNQADNGSAEAGAAYVFTANESFGTFEPFVSFGSFRSFGSFGSFIVVRSERSERFERSRTTRTIRTFRTIRTTQKSYFIANCMIRGSPDDVMRPKVALDSVVFGLSSRNQLKALNASTRASIRCPLVKRNERTSERSTWCRPGPS